MTKSEIKAARERLGLGVGEMAAALCVNVDTYSKWERGERRLTAGPATAIKMLVFINEHDLLQSWILKSARSP